MVPILWHLQNNTILLCYVQNPNLFEIESKELLIYIKQLWQGDKGLGKDRSIQSSSASKPLIRTSTEAEQNLVINSTGVPLTNIFISKPKHTSSSQNRIQSSTHEHLSTNFLTFYEVSPSTRITELLPIPRSIRDEVSLSSSRGNGEPCKYKNM